MKGNDVFLNERYLSNPTMMVVLDMKDGTLFKIVWLATIDNTFTAVVLQDGVVPDWIANGAERTYPEHAVPYEAEAMYAAFSDTMTRDGLKACAGSKRCGSLRTHTPY